MKLIIAMLVALTASCASVQKQSFGILETGLSFPEKDVLDPAPSAQVGIAQPIGNDYFATARLGFAKGDDRIEGIALHTQRLNGDFGIRQYVEVLGVMPYLGVGLSAQMLDARTSFGEHESGLAFGGYGEAGLDVPVGNDYRLGLVYRHTAGMDFDLGDVKDMNFDGGTLALTFGWSF